MATLPILSHVYGGVLVASADALLRDQIVTKLNTNRWPVLSAQGGADALGKLETSECDVILLDRRLPDLDADELIAIIRSRYPGVEVLELDPKNGSVLAQTTVPTAGAMRVFRALETLPGFGQKESVVSASAERVQQQLSAISSEILPGFLGSTEAMAKIARMVRLVAPRNTTVLITGPTG